MSASNPSNGRRRLDSWKEIAAFFGRDERTVNRWEKELALPVHRLPGTKGRVYAYADELTAWSAGPKNGNGTALAQEPSGRPASGVPPVAGPQVSGPSIGAGATPSPGRYRNAIRILAAILGVGVVALVLFRLGTIHSSKIREQNGPRSGQTSSGSVVRASTPAHNPEAEQLYLKGRYYWNKRTPEDLNRALDYFMQAVVHDPNYSQAYSGLADCYSLLREYSLMPSSEAYPRALAAAKKAVELDPQSSEAHASLAFVLFFGMWDIASGEQEFERAVELNPNNATAHHWHANGLLALHRLAEALREIDLAQTLDPASSAILADKGNILCAAGQPDEALSLLQQMEGRDPSFRSLHLYLERVYLRKQDYPNFISERRKDALVMNDDSALAVAGAAEKGFSAGGAQGMFEAMLRVQKKLYVKHSVPPTDLALTLAKLGNKKEALRYLKAAYEQRDGSLLFIEASPEFDFLHDEPGYRDLLVRMNLPLENATRQANQPPSSSELQSVAVLPFLNLSSRPEDDYISDGLADELTAALSQVEGLRVVSRTSAFEFKGKEEDIRTIGRRLNVGAVLEGSLQREGKRMRVTVQFIRVADGYHLWAEVYEADVQSVFALEDTISRAVTASLQAHLDQALGQPSVIVSTRDVEAHSLYLKGRYAWNRRTKTGVEQSIQFFRQAIQRDPQYAQAYAALAEAYTVLAMDEIASPADYAPLAKRAAQQALKLDSRLGEAYAALALIQFTYDWDFAGADRNYRRAIDLDPNNATAHHWYGLSLMARKRFGEAAKEFHIAQQLDPLSLVIPAVLGKAHFYAGEPDLAIAQAQNIIAIEPHFAYAHDVLGMGYLEKRRYKEAIAEFKQYASLYENDPDALMRLASAYAANGEREEAMRILRQLRRLAQAQYVSPCYIAQVYASLGEKDPAFEWLDKAHQQHAPALLFIALEPDYESLRQDPRFQELAHLIGLSL